MVLQQPRKTFTGIAIPTQTALPSCLIHLKRKANTNRNSALATRHFVSSIYRLYPFSITVEQHPTKIDSLTEAHPHFPHSLLESGSSQLKTRCSL